MIWPDEILESWATDNVQPFHPANINPASLDLTLGDHIRFTHPVWDNMTEVEMLSRIADGTIEDSPLWGDPVQFSVQWLLPGKFVLCHSAEWVKIPEYAVSFLFSKSSTGRVGLEHLHAGYGDCGFRGQLTFEFHNVAPWPIKLVAGKRLMQMVMLGMIKPPRTSYSVTGRYNNQTGPTPAR